MTVAFGVFAGLVGCFGLGALLGAPFLPIRRPDLEAALDLAGVTAGQTVIDLGSGDGRLLLAAARRGATAIGYEINPLLVVWSRVATWRDRRHITVHMTNFWRTSLPEADVIYTFLLTRYTARLDRKLAAEVKRPTKLVSYVFELPRPAIKQNRNTFLYQYP